MKEINGKTYELTKGHCHDCVFYINYCTIPIKFVGICLSELGVWKEVSNDN